MVKIIVIVLIISAIGAEQGDNQTVPEVKACSEDFSESPGPRKLPEPPTLNVRTVSDATHGGMITLKCTADLRGGGEMRFVLKAAKSLHFINTTDSRFMYKVRVGITSCKSEGILKLRVAKSLYDKYIGCVTYIQQEVKSCSGEDIYCKLIGPVKPESTRQIKSFAWVFAGAFVITLVALLVCCVLGRVCRSKRKLRTSSIIAGEEVPNFKMEDADPNKAVPKPIKHSETASALSVLDSASSKSGGSFKENTVAEM